ncbi:hypothetical protein F511_24972 [Dorcoceras hygrometricum]|uniref:Uncharacterized protein n=1 Tax=Dorcoceras hygrometricum TaxID=472368 RepID=A0A2Z7AP38_9LAMI|nr:hypothetical protein F511_24972 [Dorcoceras hygrometricum]
MKSGCACCDRRCFNVVALRTKTTAFSLVGATSFGCCVLPAGGIACVCLLVDQQKQTSTRVNIPVARRGNVVVSLLLPESSGFLAVLIVAQYKETQVLQLVVVLTQLVVPQEMPPRRGRGRTTRRTEEESRAGSDDDVHQVEDVTRQIGGMELVLARFQRTNPLTFSAAEGGAMAEAWLA